MLGRLRAAVAVTMLGGIFALAALVLGGLIGSIVWVVRTGTPGGALLGAVFASVAFVLVVALVRVVRASPTVPAGMGVSVMAEPELWGLVREAAAAVGTRTPDEARLVIDANAGVTEDSRFLGLAPGQRVLHIGLPLLQTLTRTELLWVLGHEMGHFSDRHTVMSGVTRRGLVALHEVVAGLGPRNVLGWLFRGYLAVYARVVHALWRGQELDADRWAATLAGPESGISALRTVASTSAAWATFVHDYASVGTGIGLVPRGLLAGFADFLSEPVHRDVDVDRLVADERRSAFDTHPSTARRIERLRALVGEQGRPVPADDVAALLVLVDPAQAIAETEAHVARTDSLVAAPWERVVRLGNRRREEERALAVMSAVDRMMSGAGDLSQAFHVVATRRGRELAELVTGGRALDDADVTRVVREALQVLVRVALVGAGHASYVLRWDRPDVVVDENGVEVDVAGLVADIPGNPDSAEWLLEVLRAEGIPRTWNPGVSSTAVGPKGPEVLAVLVVKQSMRWSFPVVYVTEAGLAVRQMGYGECWSIPPLSVRKSPAQLLAHSVRIDGIFLLGDPQTEIVPWGEVEHVTYVDGARPRLTVRRRGRSRSYRVIGVAGSALDALARFNYGRMSLG
ncbi:M48 family metallopeptidase [Nocardioides zhouii]|uniref:Peptidase M48 domain-containing protein n=1 Tax=Nocardioides zhouii TaxID=1168729 RepID=A0A4Q2SK98_9ACTN|nr:M48 family metallopeptidase [Nocardioides zhouii]RYC04464.1 hypothetical protein EUA94_20620 [Nocardioides zhouii]